MAYDRYDTRDSSRDERSRWSGDRNSDRGFDYERERGWRGQDRGRDERGFFERAGDEIASWFGDEDAERRRHEDQASDARAEGGSREYRGGRDRNLEDDRSLGRGRSDNWNQNRGAFARGGSSEHDYNRGWRDELPRHERAGRRNEEVDRWVEENNRDFGRRSATHRQNEEDYGRRSQRETSGEREYRPLAGDYSRSEGRSDRFERDGNRSDREYGQSGGSQSLWGRDAYRDTSRQGTSDLSDRSRHERDFDPHYRSWRDRHMSELDRDYDDYRREHQSKFESDFGSWRDRRQEKRGLLGQIREHMEVVGNDDKHIGTVDKVAGDRVILTKSDPESGGAHHSISCSDVGRVEGDRVILDCSADQARNRWRDESRSRALFEREDQGEMGPRMLDRSFEGTYRR